MVRILPLPQKLLWSHIKEMYQNEWVELIDCDWESDGAYPRRAIVRRHALDRVDLLKAVSTDKSSPKSVILFVGFSDSVVSFDLAGAAA